MRLVNAQSDKPARKNASMPMIIAFKICLLPYRAGSRQGYEKQNPERWATQPDDVKKNPATNIKPIINP